jgi:site-specific recombinase XerD
MPKITNEQYSKFREKGEIEIIELEELEQALKQVDGIRGKHINEGRALIIALYYTGARPIEVLSLKAENVFKEGSYVKIAMPTAKKGKPRTISLPSRFKYVRELYDYAQRNFRGRLLFYNYRGKHKVTYKTRNEVREYIDISYKLKYYVKKWFKGVRDITPYFLRHNRFSQLANAGVSPVDIQFLKGGRRLDSVDPYLHLSRKKSEELAKKIK